MPKNKPAADGTPDFEDLKPDAIILAGRERYKLASEFEAPQRERELEALRFQVPEFQWTEDERKARRGDGREVPARPMLAVSLIDQPINLVVNQMRNADLGIEITPVSEQADPKNAQARQGLYRSIERDGAELARAWAFDRATKVGRGAYRVLTVYDPDGGAPEDQKIVIRRIKYQDGVYFDPSANEPDFSDGEFAFVLAWMSAAEFKRRYPKSKAAEGGNSKLVWEGLVADAPSWVREDDVLVGEYWFKRHQMEKIKVGKEVREIDRVTVYCAKMSGWDLLEPVYQHPGQYIPLVPVVGKELQAFDEDTYYVGMIQPAMGAQKFANYAVTSLVERMALEPKAPWVAPVEAIEGFEEIWRTANQANYSVLPWNHRKADQTEPIPKPERAVIDQSGTSLSLMAFQQAQTLVQVSTAVFEPSLGQISQEERSGKAIQALQSQGDAGTSGFIKNFADISLMCEARIIMDLMPKVYNRPGRVVRILMGDDRKEKPIMINVPSRMNPNTQKPEGLPPGMPPNAPGVDNYDLTQAGYGVAVTVGKSYQTRLQEGADRIGDVMLKHPQTATAIQDLWVKYLNLPGGEEMSKRLAKLRERLMPGLTDDETGAKSPEQLQTELDGVKQKAQEMAQQLQQAMEALKTEQAKQQAQILKAQLDAEVKMRQTSEDNETKRLIAAADNETKLAIAGMQGDIKLILETLGLRREAMIADRQAQDDERDRQHEKDLAQSSQRHDAVMGELSREAPEPPESDSGE